MSLGCAPRTTGFSTGSQADCCVGTLSNGKSRLLCTGDELVSTPHLAPTCSKWADLSDFSSATVSPYDGRTKGMIRRQVRA